MIIEIHNKQSDFQAFKFVIPARAKAGKRYAYAIEYLFVEKIDNSEPPTRIITTDGFRLHYADINRELDPGFYKVIKDTQKLIAIDKVENADCTFPAYRDLIPTDYQNYCELSAYRYSTQGDKNVKVAGEYFITALGKKDIAIRLDFLLPIIEIENVWKIGYLSHDRPVTFTYDNLFALVMPFNGKYAEIEYVEPKEEITTN